MHGLSMIAGKPTPSTSGVSFQAFSPEQGRALPQSFAEATGADVQTATAAAAEAFQQMQREDRRQPAELLVVIAEQIEALGPALIEQAQLESGLTAARLTGERARTVGQLRLFAELLREGSWVGARIDTALPQRTPPRPDLRLTVLPLGPVAVFSASNFPLAFSVAGGDTASALAAGCPVVVKGHPAHPGTSELVGTAIARAVDQIGAPPGVFSLLQSTRPEISISLVRDPNIAAVGFTGSLAAGRAIFDAGVQRPVPIPVYAEMASVNPVFLLPSVAATSAIAEGIFASVTLGAGQFCTSPGLIVGVGLGAVAARLEELFDAAPAAPMLSAGIVKHFRERLNAVHGLAGVRTLRAVAEDACSPCQGAPVLFQVDAARFVREPVLRSEIFGASTVLVHCVNTAEVLEVAAALEGTLTACVHGTAEEISGHSALLTLLQRKAGRLIFNGFPTGVEVSHAMHHGGPYPSTSDSKFTSVGTAAIYRWVRPVCFQDAPRVALPAELQSNNPFDILRLVNGRETRGTVQES